MSIKGSTKDKSILFILLFILGLLFTVGLIIPLGNLFLKAFISEKSGWVGLHFFKSYFSKAATKSSLTHSLIVSLLATLITSTLSFLFALGVNRSQVRFKKIAHLVALIPLFIPSVAHGLSLIYLFGHQGIITKIMGIESTIYGLKGIVFGECIYLFPIIYLMFHLSLKRGDKRLYEFSQISGITPLKQFFKITLPSQKYSLLIALSTGFILSFTDFGVPKIVGGNYNVLATDIFKQVIGQQNLSMGAVVGVLLIIPTIIFTFFERKIGEKNHSEDSRATAFVIQKNRGRDIFLGLILALVSLTILSFILILLFSSLVEQWPYALTFTTKHYFIKTLGQSAFSILGQTLLVALGTALLGVILSFGTALMVEKSSLNKGLKKGLNFLGTLPNSIPGLSIGVGYIYFFNNPQNPLNGIYGTLGILIVANIFHFFTNPYLNAISALKKVGQEYDDTYKVMGIPPLKYLFTVLIPLCYETLFESFSYLFANAMITISAVIFLYTSKTRLISTLMVAKFDAGDTESVAALGILLLISNILCRLLFERGSKKVKQWAKERRTSQGQQEAEEQENFTRYSKEALKGLKEAFKEENIKFWLEFGTLLRVYRENSFQQADMNIDIGMKLEDYTPSLGEKLTNKGFTLKMLSQESLHYGIILNYKKKITIEIFLFNKKQSCFSIEKGVCYQYNFDPFTLEKIKFKEDYFLIPSNTKHHLKTIYGENYTLFDPLWRSEMALNRVEEKK